MNYQSYIPSINEVLSHQNAYSAKELFEQYGVASDKEAFVIALISELLTENAKLKLLGNG